MANDALDPLALGQKIVAILETGARTATYKLATLTALIDYSLENLPEDPEAALDVPIDALAHRVIDVYWRQVLPFEGQQLRQSTQAVARILRAVSELREAAHAGSAASSVDTAKLRAPDAYSAAVREVSMTLVRQPLHRLQKLPGKRRSAAFLYDDAWMHDKITSGAVLAQGSKIQLYPGVAYGLARLSGLLKPTLEILWVDDVRRMNRFLQSDVPDVAGHLFGRERIPLAPARKVLKETYGARCFYCSRALPHDNPVDHVLPWSRVGLDGMANLVLACGRCNREKLNALPAVELVDRALARDRLVLEEIGRSIDWPAQYDRVVGAARGIYRGEPAGSPTWAGPSRTTYLDLAYPPAWLTTMGAAGSEARTPAS